jgi:hypothetical protein
MPIFPHFGDGECCGGGYWGQTKMMGIPSPFLRLSISISTIYIFLLLIFIESSVHLILSF